MYSFKLLNVFVQMIKLICPNDEINLWKSHWQLSREMAVVTVSSAAENDVVAKNSFLQIISVNSQNFMQIISENLQINLNFSMISHFLSALICQHHQNNSS